MTITSSARWSVRPGAEGCATQSPRPANCSATRRTSSRSLTCTTNPAAGILRTETIDETEDEMPSLKLPNASYLLFTVLRVVLAMNRDDISSQSCSCNAALNYTEDHLARSLTISPIELAALVAVCTALLIAANTFATRSRAPTLREQPLHA